MTARTAPAAPASLAPVTPPPTTTVTIDIISDLACPWCYVGYKRLQNAIDEVTLAKNPATTAPRINLRWHPFLIDPGTAPAGEPYLAYNQRRWGGDGWVAGMKRDALSDGCRFLNWGRQNKESVWAATLHAHRLLWFVRERWGWQAMAVLKAGLFEAYYEQGVNISLLSELEGIVGSLLPEMLQGAGEGVGVAAQRTILEDFFKDDNLGRAEVLKECEEARRAGVSGVPNFRIMVAGGPGSSHQSCGGAQSTAWWGKILRKAAKMVDEQGK